MRLKGIATIDKILNDFLEPFECNARLGTDFGYLSRHSVITYALAIADASSTEFLASVEALAPSVAADPFMWSFLHELGHHETLNEISDIDYLFSANIKEKVNDEALPRSAYYECPVEKAATVWAVEYAETHFEELAALWSKLQPAIMKFYQLNNVEV